MTCDRRAAEQHVYYMSTLVTCEAVAKALLPLTKDGEYLANIWRISFNQVGGSLRSG